MTATELPPVERLRVLRSVRAEDSVAHVADVDADFELQSEPDTTVADLLALRNVSLYALDPEHGGVAFVETDGSEDLLAAPFLHREQRNHAVRVFRVPYAAFHAMAERVPEAPAPLLVHSVGRCGSTLASSRRPATPGIASLAEPDVFTSIEVAVADGSLDDDEATRLLRSACRLAPHGLAPAGHRAAIKFRSEVAWIAHLVDAAVPDAGVVFMYRDARRVIESYLRVLGRRRRWSDRLAHVPGFDRLMVERHRRRVARRGARLERFAYVLENCEPLEIEMRGRWGKFLIQWLAKVHAYVALRERRPDAAALRYEDLVAEPERVVGALFAHCGLPDSAVPAALAVLDRDSQRGTAFERGAREAWSLSPLDERELARTFTECTALAGPDAVLPGTL